MRIDEQFMIIANEYPSLFALTSPKEGAISYKELDRLSDNVANNLKALPDSIIGVSIERSFNLIITILGIIKSNKAYLPIDFSYPKDRISHMLLDSRVDTIICSKQTENIFRSANKNIFLCNELLSVDSIKNKYVDKNDSDIAYVLYTSGSTGKPHGVMVSHKAVMNTIQWRINYYSLTCSDKVLQIPSISFDSSVEDIFCTLLSGGTLCILSEDELYNVKYLSSLMVREQITHFLCVPSFYRLLLPEIYKQSCLRFVVLAGESLDINLVKQHYDRLPIVNLYNEYGPSENSICSTVYSCRPEDEVVLIGKPISNVDILILSNGNEKNYGELLLGGEGLSDGYINNIEYTMKKFQNINGKRYYKTGDFVELLPSGDLKFCGRHDQQIKIHGIRFDLSEIDKILFEKEAVHSYSVLIQDDNGMNHIASFTDEIIDPEKAIKTLSKYIPKQFLPDSVTQLKKFEYLPNGKLDVSFLKDVYLSNLSRVTPDLRTEKRKNTIQLEILDIISHYIRNPIKETDYDSSLSQIGVDSINYIKILVDIENKYEFEFDYDEMDQLTHASLAEITDIVKKKLSNIR